MRLAWRLSISGFSVAKQRFLGWRAQELGLSRREWLDSRLLDMGMGKGWNRTEFRSCDWSGYGGLHWGNVREYHGAGSTVGVAYNMERKVCAPGSGRFSSHPWIYRFR